MDEKTTAQNIDIQDEVDEMSAFDAEDEMFDMNMANDLATEMFEKQQLEEMDQFKDMEQFAAKFSETWVITLPEDPKKVNTIISTQLAKKTRKRRA